MFFEKSAGEGRGEIPSFSANLTSQWLGTLYTAAVSLGLTFLLGRVLGPEGFGTYSYVLTYCDDHNGRGLFCFDPPCSV